MGVKLTEFEKEVLGMIKKISRGRVTTYAKIARAIGRSKASRAVGNVLHKNPYAPKRPCHRVVKSDGRLGGFARGAGKKEQLLEAEGIIVRDNRIQNFNKVLYNF